jgi:hypothetical protein
VSREIAGGAGNVTVPAGLQTLSLQLERFADFLGIDLDLIAAADGVQEELDFSQWLEGPIFELLKHHEYFFILGRTNTAALWISSPERMYVGLSALP